MTSNVAESIRLGLEEALAYAEGTAATSRYGVQIPEDIDVKAIRAKLDMTQEEFAGRFGGPAHPPPSAFPNKVSVGFRKGFLSIR